MKVIDLRTPNLREVDVGTRVITSKGFEFELLARIDGKETWKDLTAGIVWYDKEEVRYDHYQALEKFGDRLPTKEMFLEAELHGFREVLPSMNAWFWSSSLRSNVKEDAWAFSGYDGDVGFDDRGGVVVSVRCAGR